MSNPIKVGLVGLGRAGWGMHVPETAGKADKFQFVAACDIIEERNEKAREKFGCRTYTDIRELVRDPEVELVDIATRSIDHYDHACIALAAGKDVFLEKPACVTYEQFKDLLTRANGEGQPKLYFRQNRRFETGFGTMRDIIASGILGNVFELRLTQFGYERRDDWQTLTKYGGGQLRNWGPHLIDHALQLLGSPIADIHAHRIQGAAGGDAEDHFAVTITGENGRYATVSISGSAALDQGRNYVAYGSRGSAVMRGNQIHLRYINPDQVLPPVESSEATPGSFFGATGTFKAAVTPDWIEKDITAPGEDLSQIWDCLYETYRNGADFPIKVSEVEALMQVIGATLESPIVKADSIQ